MSKVSRHRWRLRISMEFVIIFSVLQLRENHAPVTPISRDPLTSNDKTTNHSTAASHGPPKSLSPSTSKAEKNTVH